MSGSNNSKKSRVGNRSIVCSGEAEWNYEALCEVIVPRNWPEAKGSQRFAVAKG